MPDEPGVIRNTVIRAIKAELSESGKGEYDPTKSPADQQITADGFERLLTRLHSRLLTGKPRLDFSLDKLDSKTAQKWYPLKFGAIALKIAELPQHDHTS